MLFELVLSISFDMDLVGPAAAAIFSLICTQQVLFLHRDIYMYDNISAVIDKVCS